MQELSNALASARPVVLATVVATRRSVPRRAGTKMLVFQDGELSGTVGGGELESRVIEAADEVLRTRRPQLLNYELMEPSRGDPGVCGGELQIYLEPYMPAHSVFVVGAGHVGRAVVDLAHWLGYHTVVTDDRSERLTEDEMPNADQRLAGSMAEALAAFTVTEDTSIVVVTRSVEEDVAAIPLVLETPASYIGVMGSERRWRDVSQRLADAGVAKEKIERIHAPIGIEINAETLEEIAVSILAEVIGVTRIGDGSA